MESNNELYEAVVGYFDKRPIDIEAIKIRFKEANKFKIVDSSTNEPYDLGIKNSEFYMTKTEVG